MSLIGGVRLIVQSRVQDKLCSFGIAYKFDGGLSNSSTSALADQWWASIGAAYLGILAMDVTFEGLYVHCLEPNTALPHRLPGISQSGTRPGNSNPANSCMVVTLQTDDPGAVRQGRIYISGISKNDLIEGVWDAAFLTGNVNTFIEMLDEPIAAGGGNFTPQIVQRVIGGVPIPGNLLEVVNTRVVNIPYTQRRRTTKQLGFGPLP